MINFDQELSKPSLIKNIRNQCVSIPKNHKIDYFEIIEWCRDNLGKKRLYHPIYEAKKGHIDYWEGEWATTFYLEEESHLFWIKSNDKRIEFTLRWL